MPPPLKPSKSCQHESGFSRNKRMNSTPICSRTDRKDHCVLASRNLPLSLTKKIYTALLKYQQFKTLKNLTSLRTVRIFTIMFLRFFSYYGFLLCERGALLVAMYYLTTQARNICLKNLHFKASGYGGRGYEFPITKIRIIKKQSIVILI